MAVVRAKALQQLVLVVLVVAVTHQALLVQPIKVMQVDRTLAVVRVQLAQAALMAMAVLELNLQLTEQPLIVAAAVAHHLQVHKVDKVAVVMG
jgi:hypothetical protein